MRNIIAIIAVVLVGIAVWWGGGGLETKSYSQGSLLAEESNYDFGTIGLESGLVSHNFKLRNESGEEVVINKVYTSCMCTTAILARGEEERGPFGMPGHGGSVNTNLAVGPGEEVTVKAVFDPAAHGPAGVGRAERVIYLETNSAKEPKVVLNFTALVTE